MAFEVYYGRRSERPEKEAMVSLSKNSIVLNNIARSKLANSDKLDRLELAYDRNEDTIRIRNVKEGGIEVRKTKVFAGGFFRNFNINKKGKYFAEYNEVEKCLYVKIS